MNVIPQLLPHHYVTEVTHLNYIMEVPSLNLSQIAYSD